MKKLFIYLSIFAAILGVFYYLLFDGNDYAKSKLPILSYVRPFSFTNQNNQNITEREINGKVVVVEYFFTTCSGICPKMNHNMLDVYNQFKDDKNFVILSHTVTPEIDSVARLKQYADSLKVDANKWIFVTGSKDSLYSQARHSYLLDDQKDTSSIDDQFIHTQLFALVDKKLRVRKIVDGLKPAELNELKAEIKNLLNEKTNGSAFFNATFSNTPN